MRERAADLRLLGVAFDVWRFSFRAALLQLIDVVDDGDGALGLAEARLRARRCAGCIGRGDADEGHAGGAGASAHRRRCRRRSRAAPGCCVANQFQAVGGGLWLGDIVGSRRSGRSEHPARSVPSVIAASSAVAAGEDGEVGSERRGAREAVARDPLLARIRPSLFVAEEDAVEMLDHRLVGELTAGVAAELLGEQPVVVPAAVVLVVLDRSRASNRRPVKCWTVSTMVSR